MMPATSRLQRRRRASSRCAPARIAGRRQHHLDEVRRENGDALADEAQPLGARLARLLRPTARRRPPCGAAPRAAARCAASRLAIRVEADGRCGRPARNAACAGVSIDGVAAEVGAAGALGADDLVAVRREVQVEREDLALVEADARAAARAPPRGSSRASAARARAASRRVEQQLRHLLRDRRAAFDDRALRRGCAAARAAIAIGSTPGCDQKRRSSAASVAATSTGGRRRASSVHAARAVARQRLVERHAVAIDDDRRRRVGARRAAPVGCGPSRSQARQRDARQRDRAHDRQRGAAREPRTAAQPAQPQTFDHRLTSIDRRRRAAEHFRLVHLLRARRRRAERAGGRGADDVGELVAAFAQPRGEELDAIVVALDVIEAAALPPRRASRRSPPRPVDPARAPSAAAVVANHDSTGSKPAGSGSVTATNRRSLVRSNVSVTRTRSPALNVVAGRPSCRSRRTARSARSTRKPLSSPSLERARRPRSAGARV